MRRDGRAATDAVTIREEPPGRVQVSGALTFATVDAPLLHRSRELLGSGAARVIDLAGVAEGDSAGLALLLEWQCWAHRSGNKLTFEHLPSSLQGIAAISEAGALLE